MAATMARPTPVLPEVGSMMVPPGFNAPLCSAACTMDSAMRSLIEPPGLLRSLLTYTLCVLPNRRLIRMCGVLPMVCRMFWASMAFSIRGSANYGGDNSRHVCLPTERQLSTCLPAPTHRLHPRLADAPGRALLARVPRDARQGGQLHGLGDPPRLRHRGHAAAAGPLRARCGHLVQRHPDRARRDGTGPELCAGRRPEVCAPGARRSRGRQAGGARHEPVALCVRCRHV